MATEAERLAIILQIQNARAVAAELGMVGTAATKMSGQVASSGAIMDRTRKNSGLFGQSLTIMRKAIIGLAGASSIFAGIGLAKESLRFEASMARVKAVLSDTESFSPKVFKDLQDAAMEWGEKTVFSTSEVAEGIKELATIGWDGPRILQSIGGITSLAAASEMDMQTSAKFLASTMNQFGMEAKDAAKMADIFVAAVNAGAGEMPFLRTSLQYIGPVARQAGSSIEEVAGGLEILANNGFEGGKAGRALRMGFLRLIKPTKDVKRGVEMLNLSMDDLKDKDGSLLALPKLVKKLHSGLKGLNKGEQQEALARIFGVEAVSQWQVLVNNAGESLDSMIKKIEDSDGAAERFGKTLMDTVGGALNELGNTIENLGIKLLVAFADEIKRFLRWAKQIVIDLQNGDSAIRKFLEPFVSVGRFVIQVAFAAMKGAIGAVWVVLKDLRDTIAPFTRDLDASGDMLNKVTVAAFFGTFAFIAYKSALMVVNGAVRIATGVMAAFNAVAMANPFLIAAVAVLILAFAFYELYRNNEAFRNAVDGTIQKLTALAPVFNTLKVFAKSLWDMMKKIGIVIKEFAKTIGSTFSSLGADADFIKGVLMVIGKVLVGILIAAIAVIGIILLINAVMIMVIVTVVGLIWTVVSAIIVAVIKVFHWLWDQIMGTYQLIQYAWNAIESFFTERIPAIAGAIKDGLVGAAQWVANAFIAAKDAIASALNTVWNKIVWLWNQIKSFASGLMSLLWTPWGTAFNQIKAGIDRLVGWFQELPGKIKEAIKSIPGMISSAIIGPLSSIPGLGTAGDVLGAVGNLASNLNPFRATGGFVNERMTLVGERGPELVRLPLGSHVFTAAETQSRLTPPASPAPTPNSGQPLVVQLVLDGNVITETVLNNIENAMARA